MKSENVKVNEPRYCTLQYDFDPITYRIKSPGKFEGEPIFTPYYWDMALQGFSDKDDGKTFTFKLSDSDFKTWPELRQWLGKRRTLRLQEDSQGFVRCM